MSKIALMIGIVLAVMVHLFLLKVDVRKEKNDASPQISPVRMRMLASEPPPQTTARAVEQVSERKSTTPKESTSGISKEVVPKPELTRTSSPNRNTLPGSGDFSGLNDVDKRPELRIDWGTSAEAISIMDAAGLRLVVLSGGGSIVAEVSFDVDTWRRLDGQASDLSTYSNRVRLVDSTPAFAFASGLRRGDERLAILIPLSIEHMLKTEQVKSATNAGIESSRIRSFYGRFYLANDRVEFSISELERRS